MVNNNTQKTSESEKEESKLTEEEQRKLELIRNFTIEDMF